jgi:murein L,D-transpeptidase YcbB/YkuD
LHYGRVSPQGINYNLKLREKKLIDLPALITSSLATGAIKQLPLLVEPKLPQYQKLKAALATYKILAQKTATLQLHAEKSINPGDSLPQVQELQRFLVAVGDMPELGSNTKSTQYADKVVKGVKKFQLEHGLDADGVMGKSTIDALNVPIKDRVTQIELAMERLRWLPVFNSGPYIIVNIPAYQLWAFDDIDQKDANITNMRVVVGKALDHQTPVLMAEMRFIDFMPYWNVPYNIFKKELLPKLQQNPGYLEKENMELVATFANESKSVTFNNSSIEQLKQGNLRIRQRPGKQNALGRVKFMFPNKDDVYLHDTPSRSLFAKSRRDLSHGCVRVANPQGLAEFALKDQWNKEEIQVALTAPKTQRVVLKKSIPVLFFYSTAFFDPNNDLVLYSDIYGNDAILIDALKNSADLSDQSIFVSNNIES